ncbi:MAG TPA: response regulator [Bacteroidota bacterium]|nr:response regulator [Bacteroidota bacterium]
MPALHLLLIDDEDSFRRTFQQTLTSQGYTVDVCTSGQQALDVLSHSRFDVVLLDHSMPEMTGLNVLQWIHDRKIDVPVILLTGPGMESVATRGLKLGAYDYLRKDYFEYNHIPIIIDGVYERYLFRKDQESRALLEKKKEKQLPSLEMLRDTVTSIAHIVNTNLSVISLNIEERAHELEAFISNEGKEYLEKANSEMKQEYNLISLVSKSLIDLSHVMYERFKGVQDTRMFEEEMQNKIKTIQREHSETMEL